MLKQEFVKLARDKYGDYYSYDFLPEKITRVVESIVCKKHGEFKVIPRDHLRSKYGCPHCASDKTRIPCEKINRRYVDRAIRKFSGKFDYSETDMSAEKGAEVKIHCPEHGMFKSRLRNHLSSKCGCPVCGREDNLLERTKYKTLDDIVPKARMIHGDNYKYVAYDRDKSILIFECPKHGKRAQLLTSHFSGRGCRLCGYENRTITKDEFLNRAKKTHPEGYRYKLSELKTVNDKITIIHDCGREYKARVSNHLSGQGCRACRGSLGEAKIKEFLEHNGIDFIQQFMFDGYLFRYDFFIPELKMLIEYDGEQHFRPVEYFGGEEAFKRLQSNDRKKNKLAKEKGYLLMRISYKYFDMLEVHLARELDRHFNYRADGVFYSNIVTFCEGMGFSELTSSKDIHHYRTFNDLKPA